MERALRLAAVGAEVAARVVRTCWARTCVRFAIGFRTVGRPCNAITLLVATLAIAVLGRRSMAGMAVGPMWMPLTVVALFAALYRDAAHGGPLLWVGLALLAATIVCWVMASRAQGAPN